MEGNKDEALKCLNIAKIAIESGDKARAERFLTKACRLDPSIKIDDLLSKINGSQTEDKAPDEKAFDPLHSGPRRRVPPSKPSSSSSSSSASTATYTEGQISVIREIKRKKDYYEILGLEKNCSAEDIRKAYRKLSLKVHPDKNPAPGSEEAFKMVSKAFQCLSNEESRKKYDLTGSEEPVYQRRGNSGFNRGGFNNGFYDGEFDADEIFRNFFFGRMNPATTTNFNGFSFGPGVRVRTGGVEQSPNWLRTVIQLLPVILILLVNFLPSSEPLYSLSQSYSHDYKLVTPKGVNYFVKSENFEQQYPPNSEERAAVEQRVEDDYHSMLVHNCRHEWQQVQWGYSYRRGTPYCDALKRFEALVK